MTSVQVRATEGSPAHGVHPTRPCRRRAHRTSSFATVERASPSPRPTKGTSNAARNDGTSQQAGRRRAELRCHGELERQIPAHGTDGQAREAELESELPSGDEPAPHGRACGDAGGRTPCAIVDEPETAPHGERSTQNQQEGSGQRVQPAPHGSAREAARRLIRRGSAPYPGARASRRDRGIGPREDPPRRRPPRSAPAGRA